MNDEIRSHIDAVTRRPEADDLRLASLFIRMCWPGGSGDRFDRASLTRLASDGPDVGYVGELPLCTCASGRCVACN